jgi:ATP-dependent DNA helicase RecQ
MQTAGDGRAGRTRKRQGTKAGGPERIADRGVAPADAPLFEALRVWRRELAAEQKLPPYVIFHDATLAAIARRRPATTDELAEISGVGQAKLERYGADVLRVVAEKVGG